MKIEFSAVRSESKYCGCDCCHGEGQVTKIKYPITRYYKESDYKELETKYREVWMCDSCRDLFLAAIEISKTMGKRNE